MGFRDSIDRAGGVFEMSPQRWSAFTQEIKSGQFDQ
ncbi:DUF397 domain-containing protein [Saccharopolyspora soli]